MTINQPDPVPNKPAKNYIYSANNTRTLLVVYSFLIFTFFSAITLIMGTYTLIKYNIAERDATEESYATVVSIAEKYDLASGVSAVFYLLCAIIFLFWIYRASANTLALNKDKKIKFTPAWSFGSYFIPFLNLYWPYKSMKEMWLLNIQNKEGATTSLILIWWLTYLVLNLTATAVSKLSDKDVIGMQGYVTLDVISNIAGILSALLAISIVRKINAAQRDTVKTTDYHVT